MATVAKWITRNGHKVYLRKGGSQTVHNDYYRVEGKGIKPDANQKQDAYHFLDRKHAMNVAKANVRVKNMHHDMKTIGFEAMRTQKDKLRVGALQREIRQSQKITNNIYAKHRQSGEPIRGKDMDTLDNYLHTRPYLQTELKNLGGREL